MIVSIDSGYWTLVSGRYPEALDIVSPVRWSHGCHPICPLPEGVRAMTKLHQIQDYRMIFADISHNHKGIILGCSHRGCGKTPRVRHTVANGLQSSKAARRFPVISGTSFNRSLRPLSLLDLAPADQSTYEVPDTISGILTYVSTEVEGSRNTRISFCGGLKLG